MTKLWECGAQGCTVRADTLHQQIKDSDLKSQTSAASGKKAPKKKEEIVNIQVNTFNSGQK